MHFIHGITGKSAGCPIGGEAVVDGMHRYHSHSAAMIPQKRQNTRSDLEIGPGGGKQAQLIVAGDVLIQVRPHALGVAHLAEDPSVG